MAANSEKKLWWLSTRKVVERYVREAKLLMLSQEKGAFVAALGLLEAALAMAPRMDAALEMKARCLLSLRRFKDVADLLHDSIPSFRTAVADELWSASEEEGSSMQLTGEKRAKMQLLSSCADEDFKCFSVADLKEKLMAGLGINGRQQGQWRYLVLGQACCHLGLMEDAIVLLKTGKRLAAAAFRRESVSLSDDIFSSNMFPLSSENFLNNPSEVPPKMESESIAHLLCHIKLLVRRKSAALASFDAGLYSESIKHFSKILDGRRSAPQSFLAQCYVYRASAYQLSGRIADAIADCNKALALETSSIQALAIRASLFETIRCFPDCLHDLEHLKLLYNSILRDRKLPGPVWKRQSFQYREIPGKLCSLASKIQQLQQRVAAGETQNTDFYALMGLNRNCSKSELQRSHLVLTLKHKPDKSSAFIDRCEFADANEADYVRDRARVSALLLYRLIQKGYASIMAAILEEEAKNASCAAESPAAAAAFQGVFCRDLAAVRNMLSQAGFSRPIPLKYEALSC